MNVKDEEKMHSREKMHSLQNSSLEDNIFFSPKLCYGYLLEYPWLCDSNEYLRHIFCLKKISQTIIKY